MDTLPAFRDLELRGRYASATLLSTPDCRPALIPHTSTLRRALIHRIKTSARSRQMAAGFLLIQRMLVHASLLARRVGRVHDILTDSLSN